MVVLVKVLHECLFAWGIRGWSFTLIETSLLQILRGVDSSEILSLIYCLSIQFTFKIVSWFDVSCWGIYCLHLTFVIEWGTNLFSIKTQILVFKWAFPCKLIRTPVIKWIVSRMGLNRPLIILSRHFMIWLNYLPLLKINKFYFLH